MFISICIIAYIFALYCRIVYVCLCLCPFCHPNAPNWCSNTRSSDIQNRSSNCCGDSRLYQTHILYFPKAWLKCFYRSTHIYPLPLNPCINSKSPPDATTQRQAGIQFQLCTHCSGHSSICQTTACSQTTEWETLQQTNGPPFILPAKAQDKNTLLDRTESNRVALSGDWRDYKE